MLLKNTAIYSIGEFAGRIGKFLSLYLVASLVSKTDFGSYAFILSLAMIVATLFDFGDNTLVLLRLTRVKIALLLPYFHLAKLTTTLCCGALVLAVYFSVGRPVGGLYPSLLPAFIAFCVAWDLQTFLGNVQRSRMDFAGEMWSKLAANFGFLLVIVLMIVSRIQISVAVALWVQAATLFSGAAYSFARIRPNLSRILPPWRHARRGILSILRIGLPMTLAASVGVLQASIDSLVLGGTSHLAANASFTITQRMAQLTYLPLGVIVSVSLPYLSEGLKSGKRTLDARLLNHAFVGLVLAGGIIGQIFVVVGEVGIPFALGKRYSDVAQYSQVAALYIVPYYIFPVLTNLLWVMRAVVATQSVYGISTAVSFALDLLVIRYFGPFGVAWVAVFINWAVLACFIGLYRQRSKSWPLQWPTMAAAILTMICIGAPDLIWPSGSGWEIGLRAAITLSFAVALAVMIWRQRKFLTTLAKHRGMSAP